MKGYIFIVLLLFGCQLTTRKQSNCVEIFNNQFNYVAVIEDTEEKPCFADSIEFDEGITEISFHTEQGNVGLLDLVKEKNRKTITSFYGLIYFSNKRQIDLSIYPNLETIILQDCLLNSFDSVALNESKLRVLSLPGNSLTVIPKNLHLMTELKVLNLYSNDISYIDTTTQIFNKIDTVYLAGNPLNLAIIEKIRKMNANTYIDF